MVPTSRLSFHADYSVVVCGHSLGAGVAVLLTMLMLDALDRQAASCDSVRQQHAQAGATQQAGSTGNTKGGPEQAHRDSLARSTSVSEPSSHRGLLSASLRCDSTKSNTHDIESGSEHGMNNTAPELVDAPEHVIDMTADVDHLSSAVTEGQQPSDTKLASDGLLLKAPVYNHVLPAGTRLRCFAFAAPPVYRPQGTLDPRLDDVIQGYAWVGFCHMYSSPCK